MSDVAGSPAGSEAADVSVLSLPADAPEVMSIADAVAAMQKSSQRPPEEDGERRARSDEGAEAANPDEEELAAQADDTDAERPPGEEEQSEAEEPEAEELPTIDPPRALNKDEKEAFKSWPRAAQESFLRLASSRDVEVRRIQNEAAEKDRTLQAKLSEATQAKQQYDAGIQLAQAALLREQARFFPDIRTFDDAKRLQQTDPLRYQEWDLHQKELAHVSTQAREVQERQAAELVTQWNDHVSKENQRAAELIPELADKEKGDALRKRAATEWLPKLGFTPSELADLAEGKTGLSIFDHRIQQLIVDSMKLGDIQKAKAAVVRKPVPQVQRPGTSRGGANPSIAQQIKALESQQAGASGERAIRIGAQIMALQRRAAGGR